MNYIYTVKSRWSELYRETKLVAMCVVAVFVLVGVVAAVAIMSARAAYSAGGVPSGNHPDHFDPSPVVKTVESVAETKDEVEEQAGEIIVYDPISEQMEIAIENAASNRDGRFYFPEQMHENTYEFFFRPDVPLDEEMQMAIFNASVAYNLDPTLVYAVIWQETHFKNVAAPGDGSGYMQIVKKWHTARMERLGVEDLMDGPGNVMVGCDYLAGLMDIYDLPSALGAYNTGSPCVNGYAKSVLAKYDALWEGEYDQT